MREVDNQLIKTATWCAAPPFQTPTLPSEEDQQHPHFETQSVEPDPVATEPSTPPPPLQTASCPSSPPRSRLLRFKPQPSPPPMQSATPPEQHGRRAPQARGPGSSGTGPDTVEAGSPPRAGCLPPPLSEPFPSSFSLQGLLEIEGTRRPRTLR